MKRVLIIMALLFSSAAHAGEWGLVIHGASYHFQQRNYIPYNQANDGFGLRYAFDDKWSAQAGHYRNSLSFPGYNFFSNYGIVEYMPYSFAGGNLRLGGFGGLVSGYDKYDFFVDPKDTSHLQKVVITQDGVIEVVGGLSARVKLMPHFDLTTRLGPGVVAIEGTVTF